ncbi:MAG: class I SAM-dependent methyltransferase [Caldilineaceae bacterium]|nr:class I SAM-dependent methyltransferase [Caldilineaceae bacterium]
MNLFKKTVKMLLPKPLLESLVEAEAKIARTWAAQAHRHLLGVQWSMPPQPEHFDHHIDLYDHWLRSRNPMWLERGIFGSLVLRGGRVLELACGDGFNARNFYSLRSEHVLACDFNPQAIQTARAKNSAPNVEFVLADIRTDMPGGTYENIVWDAAIEHFTPTEIHKIMADMKSRLAEQGILSGHTIVERSDGTKSLTHHEYEFRSKEDLLRFIEPHFQNTVVFETKYPDRHNLYFWASNGTLPFDPNWPQAVAVHKQS